MATAERSALRIDHLLLTTFEPQASRRRRQRIAAHLHGFGGQSIPPAGAVNKVDMAALGRRGNEARYLRRPLPEDAPMDKRLRSGKPRLERVSEFRGAVERHAQAVVELAKIGVGDKLARIGRRVEATHLELENMEEDRNAVAANRRYTRLRLRQSRGLLDPCLKRDRPACIPRPQARQSDRPLARRSGERRFDNLVDERRKSRVVSAWRNDQRQNKSVLRRRHAPTAGEAGKIWPRARLRGR